MRLEKYKGGRHWAVYDGQELVCLTVYKVGGLEVIRRLTTESNKSIEDTGKGGDESEQQCNINRNVKQNTNERI